MTLPGYPPPPHQFIAFIDESGDPGIKKVFPIDSDGASEWLAMGAIVIDVRKTSEPVAWVKQARSIINQRQRPDLHFNRLSQAKKVLVCRYFATLPMRGFVVISNKKNMRAYRNRHAEKMPSQQWFYNWCVRLLLERLTDWCERRSLREFGEPRHAKLIFSERGGIAYSQMKAYHILLKQQAGADTTYLKKRQIKPSVLDWQLVDHQPHRKLAGLQIADALVGSFFQAADYLGPTNWDTSAAKEWQPRMATERGIIADYGVALQPTPPSMAKLLPQQQEIFRFYGYSGF